jgi:hypothetical protein
MAELLREAYDAWSAPWEGDYGSRRDRAARQREDAAGGPHRRHRQVGHPRP